LTGKQERQGSDSAQGSMPWHVCNWGSYQKMEIRAMRRNRLGTTERKRNTKNMKIGI
jgi:hypothetical protein